MNWMKVQKTSEDSRSQMSKTWPFSELRIVLLGCVQSGKSSAGNTILGREEFELKRTAQCVKRQGEVAGRHITVIEAPGWFINELLEESTEFRKQEIVLSVSKCPPGPHCLLLVIDLGLPFIENHRRVLENHLKLFTETVWSYTIVLFTCGDCLGNTPIEQHIESEGKALQLLVEKCGNRYHVLNNEKRGDKTQVTELLEKIEEMVVANSGHCFEMDRNVLLEVEEKRKAEKERARERMIKVQKQRDRIRAKMGDKQHLPELRIVLLGYRYAGKSSAGNTILGREEFALKRTAQCVKRQGKVAGRHITVVEAPGWWRNIRVEESTELLKHEIVLSVSLCPPEPHCLLLVIRVDSKFKAKQRKALEGHLKLFLKTVWSHTMVLFTFGDRLGETPIEQHIESEGNALQCLVEKCGNRYHVLNNMNRSDHTQVTELLEKIEEMVAANCGEKRRAEEERVEKRKERRQPKDIRAKMEMELPESSDTASPSIRAEEFMPDVKDNKNNILYSFVCSRAGQFQCKLTNIVFEMEGKGEVLYRLLSWDTDPLDELGQMQPAGPLYDVDCFEGSVSHLHLPHCEILTDENQVELAVAHYTGDNLQITEPQKVTNTHVIIAIEGLSLFGLLTKIFLPRPIKAQVLFFYKQVTGRQDQRELHIHLLPKNVPLSEVKNQNLDFTNFKTSSNCQLTPGKKYKPLCDPFVSQPMVETFERDNGPNYHPTFVVLVEAKSIRVSLLEEDGAEVWAPRDILLTGCSTETAQPSIISGAEFVDKHRAQLIARVSSVMEIADDLRDENMITKEEYNKVYKKETDEDKMRILYEALDSGGPEVKAAFYKILKDKQHYLVEHLERLKT